MKKIMAFLIIGMFCLTFVSAVTDSDYNFFRDIGHRLGLFTAEGQSRSCDINARTTITQTGTWVTHTIAQLTTGAGCTSGVSLIDTFDSSWHFLNEYRSEDIGGGISKQNPGYLEIYCCPYEACNSNSDCSVSPASNYGNTCNINYGSCYSSIPTHSTKVYKCISGSWVQQSSASYGEDNFCSSSTQNNYIDQTGNEHCATSSSSAWCVSSGCTTSSSCNDNNACTTDICSNNACSNIPINGCSTSCNDNNVCTTDILSGGSCNHIAINGCCLASSECSDGNSCTLDNCNNNACSNIPISCNDGDECTTDICSSGACQHIKITNCGSCNTNADTDCNGVVDRTELGDYIDLWVQGSVSRTELGTVITAWALS